MKTFKQFCIGAAVLAVVVPAGRFVLQCRPLAIGLAWVFVVAVVALLCYLAGNFIDVVILGNK